MFEKKCPICNNKFKKSDGQTCSNEELGILLVHKRIICDGRYPQLRNGKQVLVCKECYETRTIKKEKKNMEFDKVCNECGCTVQEGWIADEGVMEYFCPRCQKTWSPNEIKIIQRKPFDLSDIDVVMDKTKSQISLYYAEAQMVDTKLFVSKKDKKQKEEDFHPIETKEKKKPILKNRIQLEIELANEGVGMTTWNKKTTDYNIHDDFGGGYSLTIAFSEPDNVLMNMIMPVVREYGFGPIQGKQWTHCHFSDKNPSHEKAEILLQRVTNSITEKLQKLVKT